jgi:hypothetical protein
MASHVTHAIRWKVFALAAVAINLVAFLMARLAPRPAVEFGAAVDVAVTVPALYFLLIVRGGMQPLASLLPLCLLGILRATYVAPGIAWARPVVGVGVELALAALIVGRVRRGLKSRGQSADVLDRLETAALEIVPARRLAAVLASELAVFYYAFAAWRRTPHVPAGARAFSIHEQSGVAALFGMLAGVSVMEAALVHLVVMRWSVAAAWGLTTLSGYGAIWLIAMARAFVLRPVLLEGGELVVRSGMMWTARVPLEAIAASEPGGAKCGLRVPPASEPNVTLRLSEAVTARGMYGMTRQVASIGLAVDDRDAFMRALSDGAA